jgi:hypothetical protein
MISNRANCGLESLVCYIRTKYADMSIKKREKKNYMVHLPSRWAVKEKSIQACQFEDIVPMEKRSVPLPEDICRRLSATGSNSLNFDGTERAKNKNLHIGIVSKQTTS